MQMSIPSIPDSATGCVVTSLWIDVIAALVLVSAGALFPGLIALALAVLVYWFVYRNLAEDVAAAWAAGAITAAVHAALAVVWLLTEDPFGFAAGAVVAACLGYALVAIGKPRQPIPTAQPVIATNPQRGSPETAVGD